MRYLIFNRIMGFCQLFVTMRPFFVLLDSICACFEKSILHVLIVLFEVFLQNTIVIDEMLKRFTKKRTSNLLVSIDVLIRLNYTKVYILDVRLCNYFKFYFIWFELLMVFDAGDDKFMCQKFDLIKLMFLKFNRIDWSE